MAGFADGIVPEPLAADEGGGLPGLSGCEAPREAAADLPAPVSDWSAAARELAREAPPVTLGGWRPRLPPPLHASLRSLAEEEGVGLDDLVFAAPADPARKRGA